MPKKMTESVEKKLTPIERFRERFDEVPTPTGGLPTMPINIAVIPSDDLGNLIARYSAWREFTEDRHLEALAIYSQYKSEYDLATDTEMLKSSANTVTERKASAKLNERVVALYKNMDEARIYVELLGGKLQSFTNVLATLSRELTRRGITND